MTGLSCLVASSIQLGTNDERAVSDTWEVYIPSQAIL